MAVSPINPPPHPTHTLGCLHYMADRLGLLDFLCGCWICRFWIQTGQHMAHDHWSLVTAGMVRLGTCWWWFPGWWQLQILLELGTVRSGYTLLLWETALACRSEWLGVSWIARANRAVTRSFANCMFPTDRHPQTSVRHRPCLLGTLGWRSTQLCTQCEGFQTILALASMSMCG